MDYAPLAQRIAGEGTAAWDIHFDAQARQAGGEDVILLSVGDPDLATPAPVVDRAVAAMRVGDTHYPPPAGQPALRAAVAEHVRAAGGWAPGPENVSIVGGAQAGLFQAGLLLLRPGDEVLVPNPTFIGYTSVIRAAGAEAVAVPPAPGGGFRPDPEALARAVTPRTRAILFGTPNNPTGAVLDMGELVALAEIARSHDLWVIVDEVYAALTFDAPHRAIAALEGMGVRTVTVSSLSKSHAMTGWRVGWMVGPPDLAGHVQNMALTLSNGVPGFVQQAALEALVHADRITGEMRRVYRRRRDLLLDWLAEAPGVRAVVPQAGMFLLADVSGTGLEPATFARRLLDAQGVSVLDAGAFGPGAEACVRLAYTLDETWLAEAARRMVMFARDLAEAGHGCGDLPNA